MNLSDTDVSGVDGDDDLVNESIDVPEVDSEDEDVNNESVTLCDTEVPEVDDIDDRDY